MVRTILKMEEEIQRQILSIGIALDNECHETHMLMKALTSKFGPIKGDVKPDPVMTSWCFDDETDMVTITYDSGEQEVYWLENIMTKQRLGLMEELHNATCTNTKMDSKLELMQDMFKWRLQNLQEQEADEGEGDDMDEDPDEDSEEEEDDASDEYVSDKVPSDEGF